MISRNILGVLTGAISLFLLNRLSAIGWTIYIFGVRKMNREEVAAFHENSYLYYIFGILVYAISCILGGYLTAKITKSEKYYDVLIMAAISIGIGNLYMSFIKANYGTNIQIPTWYEVLPYLLLIPCTLFGGYIVKRKITKHNNATAELKRTSCY